MPYADWFPLLAPSWLQAANGKAFWRQIGVVFDDVRDRGLQSTKARFPSSDTPTDALDEIGRDRQLPRASGESNADYAARLKDAWTVWGGDDTAITGVGGGAGSHLGLLNALAVAGLPTGATGATIVQQNGRYSQLDGSGNLVLGTLMDCVNRQDLTGAVPGNFPGWTFDGRDTFWSAFGIVFPVDVPSLVNSSSLLSLLHYAVGKWKPAKALFIGTWVIDTGITLGWPTGRTLGADPNLGGNVIRYLPPLGGNKIGYAP